MECPASLTQGLLLLLLWACLSALAVGLMLVARAGPRVATSLLLLLTFAQVACSVFSPHWLPPTDDDPLLPDALNAITAVLNSPTTLPLFWCTDWRYEQIFVLTVTQPAQMLAAFGLLFVPCYCYKYTKKGEGSEWSMGNLYLYLQGYYMYLHVVYMMIIATCLQPLTCQAHTYQGEGVLQKSLESLCEEQDPPRQSTKHVLQAVGLIVIFLVGFSMPAGSVLCFFIPSLRRRLQEHSRLPKNYIEHQPGYYLVRDQHWSRFTMCRQFKPGSAKVVARQGGRPITVSYERFWLSVEMTWKLSLLLLPLIISDTNWALKYIPGAISTFIMLVLQTVRRNPADRKNIVFVGLQLVCFDSVLAYLQVLQPYMSQAQNYVASAVYFVLLLLYVAACAYHSTEAADPAKPVVRMFAAAITGCMSVLLLLNFFKEMYVWRRSYRDDQEAHRLEDMFKAELKETFQASEVHKVDQTGKIYDTEELVDLEMYKKLHEVFETVRLTQGAVMQIHDAFYKVCYNQVVAEVREDTEQSGAFDLPPEPLMETESWRRVASLPSMNQVLPTKSGGPFDDKKAEDLAREVERYDVQRGVQQEELAALRVDSNEQLVLTERECELHRTEERLAAAMDEWSRQVGGWIDINVAEWLASYVLAELKQEKINGNFKYSCFRGPDSDLIDRKFLAYLKSKVSMYVIALQSGCRSKAAA